MSFSATGVRATAPRARTLLDIFTATALRCGVSTAIDAPDAVLSYRGLDEASDAVAARLRGLGIGPGDRVAIQVPSGTSDLYVAILGAVKAGAAYVPIDADDPPARAAEILERSAACAVIRDGSAIEWVRRPGGQTRPVRPDDDTWVIFTSGSTGAPKGVAVSHRSAAAFVDAEARLWRVERDDRVLAGLSVAFDASCEEIWLAWGNGAALVPAPRSLVRAGAELGPWLAQRDVTVVSTVPTLAAMWDEASLAGVRLLILGGEACPEPLGWRLAAGREVWNTYGPTEATVVSTAAPIIPGRPVSIGWPLDGWETAVIDENGEPVEPGEVGELVIAGAGVARYLDPILDTERFPPVPSLGWERAYPTGDIVRETANGLLFVGRRDHQVKIGGRRIELGEIDAQLSGLDGVRAAVTVVQEPNAGTKLLVAYLVGDVDPDTLRAVLHDRLPDALVPLLVILDELPQTASGKVDRAALPWPPPHSGRACRGDLGGTSGWVAERWRDQLGPVTITPDSHFFALGGSSLAAAKLTSDLRERFPAVAVADIYEHGTLGALTARLEALGSTEQSASAEPRHDKRRWGLIRAAGALGLVALSAPWWLLAILAFNRISPNHPGPQAGWIWLALGWLVLTSVPARVGMLLIARRFLLADLRPGRYPRASWMASRLWFVERLAELVHLESLAGTPWAARYARLMGHRIGDGTRLGTIPPPTSLIAVGDRATLEPDVDIHGWWIDGHELVVRRAADWRRHPLGNPCRAHAGRVGRQRSGGRGGSRHQWPRPGWPALGRVAGPAGGRGRCGLAAN